MPRERANSPSVGEGEIFRHSCGADAGGEIDPIPGDGGFSPSEGEKMHAAACRDAPLPGRGEKGDRTPRFPVPSCDSPTFL